jgi:hypothetical protein
MKYLNEQEALSVVIFYLQDYYSRTKPDDTGIIIKGLQNNTLDQYGNNYIFDEWKKCLRSKIKENDQQYFTEADVFEAMFLLLDYYYKKTKSDDIGGLLSDLLHIDYGATADPAAWSDWQRCLAMVKP